MHAEAGAEDKGYWTFKLLENGVAASDAGEAGEASDAALKQLAGKASRMAISCVGVETQLDQGDASSVLEQHCWASVANVLLVPVRGGGREIRRGPLPSRHAPPLAPPPTHPPPPPLSAQTLHPVSLLGRQAAGIHLCVV